ncbi:MAG: peptide ABC transporter substrate-binding protein [Proteobacteria bacterium]|nr:peptide ABC transporter substrate-binding protein [Pseudomonadota bacterium]
MLSRLLGFLIVTLAAQPSLGAKEERPFVIAVTQEVETLNPILIAASAATYTTLFVNRPLVLIGPNWTWICGLCDKLPSIEAGSAKIIEEKGQKKVVARWHLRPGITWADGTRLTAKDVRLGWEVGRSPNVAVAIKDDFDRIEAITLDPKDPLAFTVTFKEARFDFYQLQTIYALPSHIEGPIWERTKGENGAYEKNTTYATHPTNPGLYDGPYHVTEWKPGNQLAMQRSKAFYGGPAHIERITLKWMPRLSGLDAALLNGTVDMMSELGMSLDQAMQFDKRLAKDNEQKGRLKLEMRDGLTYEHIDLNLRNPILRDKGVRQALVYAIDRNKLSQALFYGRQVPATQYFHPLDVFYAPDVVKYEYNPKKAEQLLEAAGWLAKESGPRYKDGKKLELSIMTTQGDKLRELVEQFVQSELRKVGVAVTIHNEPPRVFFGETMTRAKFPAMAMYAWVATPDFPPRGSMHSKEIPTHDNGWNGQNFPGWKNPRVDAILDQAAKEFDAGKRKVLMAELMRIYTDEVPAIPLYLRSEIAIVPTKLEHFRITGHSQYSSQEAEVWSLAP